jgi:hypothetical protein
VTYWTSALGAYEKRVAIAAPTPVVPPVIRAFLSLPAPFAMPRRALAVCYRIGFDKGLSSGGLSRESLRVDVGCAINLGTKAAYQNTAEPQSGQKWSSTFPPESLPCRLTLFGPSVRTCAFGK